MQCTPQALFLPFKKEGFFIINNHEMDPCFSSTNPIKKRTVPQSVMMTSRLYLQNDKWLLWTDESSSFGTRFIGRKSQGFIWSTNLIGGHVPMAGYGIHTWYSNILLVNFIMGVWLYEEMSWQSSRTLVCDSGAKEKKCVILVWIAFYYDRLNPLQALTVYHTQNHWYVHDMHKCVSGKKELRKCGIHPHYSDT
jgi:hypothetical protein